MPRTKKSPTSTPARTTDAGTPMEARKGSGPSVAPDLEARVVALERAVSILALHLPDAIFLARVEMDAFLEKLEQRLSAAGSLVRIALPEASHDEVFAEFEGLPCEADERRRHVRELEARHLRRIGVLPDKETAA